MGKLAGDRNVRMFRHPGDEVDDTSILKTGDPWRYRRSLPGCPARRYSPPPSTIAERFSALALKRCSIWRAGWSAFWGKADALALGDGCRRQGQSGNKKKSKRR
jgi:hypothetical protein